VEKVSGDRGGYNRWTINGKSWPRIVPLFTTDNHPVHIHRYTFEVTKIGDRPTAGVKKDTSGG
jgi:hypothetical protein